MTRTEQQPEPARLVGGKMAYWVLAGLIAGLLAGLLASGADDGLRESLVEPAQLIGGLWLNALKMTVIPLMVALLIVGVARGAEAALAGRIAGRSVLWFVIVCTLSAIFGALLMPLLLQLFPLPAGASEALRAGLQSVDPTTAAAPVPGIGDFFSGIVPSNVVAAASNGDILPLVVFTFLFALAVSRIDAARRTSLVGFFEAIADALLVVIGWVLLVAPIGIFALGFALAAGAGGAAFAGLAHYVLLVSVLGVLVTLAGYPIGIIGGRVRLGTFARSMIAPQSVAISTRSSLATLPAMLAAADAMGIRKRTADVTLPMAVALFRATGPAMNVGVALYVAHWLGLEPSMTQMIAATAVAAVISYGAVSLPGEVSFISSIAPVAMALGVPIAPLALLVAVEMIPDIFRTVGNVTLDVAVTSAVDRRQNEPLGSGVAEA